jgi:UDP-glucose 4-epimerase
MGQRLCRRLLDAGMKVTSVSRRGAPEGKLATWASNVEWIAAPLDSDLCSQIVRKTDYLFHLASTTIPSTSNSDVVYDIDSNVSATIKMLTAAAATSIQRIVFISSGGAVYGTPQRLPISETHPTDPICSYGIHKLAIEKYLHLFRTTYGLGSVTLRVSNIYGESQDSHSGLGAIAHFTNSAVNGDPIEIWGDGTITRDYIHVDDVVMAVLKSVLYRGPETVLNIGTGRGTSLNEIVGMIEAQLESRVRIVYRPARNFDVQDNLLDASRAARELSWSPTISLESGVDRMIRAAQCIKTSK